MTEPVVEPAAVTVEVQPEPKPTETVDFWKQKARLQEERAKANATAAQRLAELENAQKTDAERQADALRTAQSEVEQARSEAARLRVATRYQLLEDDVDLLGAGSEEQIEARAQRLAELYAAANTAGGVTPAATPRRPVESLRPGATPAVMPLNGDGLENAVKGLLGIQ